MSNSTKLNLLEFSVTLKAIQYQGKNKKSLYINPRRVQEFEIAGLQRLNRSKVVEKF